MALWLTCGQERVPAAEGVCRGQGQEHRPGRPSRGQGWGRALTLGLGGVGPQVACAGDGEMGHCWDIWMEELRGSLGRTPWLGCVWGLRVCGKGAEPAEGTRGAGRAGVDAGGPDRPGMCDVGWGGTQVSPCPALWSVWGQVTDGSRSPRVRPCRGSRGWRPGTRPLLRVPVMPGLESSQQGP